MSEIIQIIEYLATTKGRERNNRIERVLQELEASMPKWQASSGDKEAQHVTAEFRIAALLVLVCKDIHRERVTEIAKAFLSANGWLI